MMEPAERTGQSNGRGVGWEFVHVCVDDASRLAFTQIKPDERKRRGLPQGRRRPLCKPRRHRRTRHDRQWLLLQILRLPQRLSAARPQAHSRQAIHPKTNGKAERFVQTCLREWAYARAYLNSKQRAQELPFFLHRYNWHRPHASISGKPLSADSA
jgi:transposase InsO family protein